MQPRVLGGRYELTSLIATGGMGQVWQARDRVLSRDVAVKLLRSEYTGDPTFLARFRAEAQLAAGLVHPNIATLFDYGEVPPAAPGEEHLAYLVMELVRGESLSGLLRREGRLPADRTLEVLRQSAAGLAAAHAAGVVHRDVKPGNVLLGADGTVKITDFGVAVSGSSVPLTQTGQVIGTPHYLSPEQAQGARATPASDVYALGLIGYECLAGHRAFDADSSVQVALMQIRDTPPPLPGDVPPPVRAFIDATLAKDPAARFPDGAAVVAAIDAVRAGRPLPLPAGADRTTVLPADDDRTTVLPPAAAQTSVLPAAGAAGAAAGAAGAAAAARPMPPLRLPPESETGAHDRPRSAAAPVDRPARRWRRVLVPLIAVLVLAGLVFGALQLTGSGGDEPTADTTTPSSTAPGSTPSATAEQVTIASADYEGRPYPDAQADLAALGLEVTLRPVQTGDADEGDVLSVSPEGRLAAGSTVTVSYATAPPATPTPSRQPVPVPTVTPDSGDGGNEDEPDEDEPDEDEGGGNGSEGNGSQGGGNGNGNGNGQGNGNGNGNGQGNGNGNG